MRLKVHDSLLPQEDDEVEQRRNELEEKKKIYQFEWSDSDLMPMSKGIPSDEEFTEQYAVSSVVATMAFSLKNFHFFLTVNNKIYYTYFNVIFTVYRIFT